MSNPAWSRKMSWGGMFWPRRYCFTASTSLYSGLPWSPLIRIFWALPALYTWTATLARSRRISLRRPVEYTRAPRIMTAWAGSRLSMVGLMWRWAVARIQRLLNMKAKIPRTIS